MKKSLSLFKLSNVPCMLKTFSSKGTSLQAAGVDQQSKTRAKLELVLEVNVTECPKDVESLFPMLDSGLKIVSGLEKSNKGFTMNARTKLENQCITLRYSGDKSVETFVCLDAPIKKAPTVRVNEDGDAVMVLKVTVLAEDRELATLAHWCPNATLTVTCESVQIDHSIDQVPAEKPKRGKGKKAEDGALFIADDGAEHKTLDA